MSTLSNNIEIFIKNNETIVLIALIALVAIIVIITIDIMFGLKNKKKQYKKVIIMSDKNRIYKGLNGAGVTIHGKETFENDNIVFDSIDKINNNFEKFLDYYMPVIEINNVNNVFKKYNIDTTIQKEITNKKINATNLLSEPYGFISQALLSAYSTKNTTDLILLGLSSALLLKLQFNLIKDYQLVYFDDYNKETTDFVIYFVPPKYSKNIALLREDNTILDMNEANITGNEVFKISLFNHLDKLLSLQVINYKKAQLPINQRNSKTDILLYEEDKDMFINEIYKNKESIRINSRLYLVSLFSFIYDPASLIILKVDLEPKSTDLANYIIDRMFNSDYYTKNYYNYLTMNIDTTKLNTTNEFGLLLKNVSTIASNIIGVIVPSSSLKVSVPNNTVSLATTNTQTSIIIPTTTLPMETTSTNTYSSNGMTTSTIPITSSANITTMMILPTTTLPTMSTTSTITLPPMSTTMMIPPTTTLPTTSTTMMIPPTTTLLTTSTTMMIPPTTTLPTTSTTMMIPPTTTLPTTSTTMMIPPTTTLPPIFPQIPTTLLAPATSI